MKASVLSAVLFAAALSAMEAGNSGLNENAATSVQTFHDLGLRLRTMMHRFFSTHEPLPVLCCRKTFSGTVVLPGIPSHIQLDPVWIMGNGTVGWANSDPGFEDNISYGRIYVYGIRISQGVPWIGRVYPTNKTVRYWNSVLPCYAVTSELAEIINSEAQ